MSHQPIDPDVTLLFAELGPPTSTAISEVAISDLRNAMRETVAIFTRGAQPIEIPDVVDRSVPGREGEIEVRVYRPPAPTSVMVYLHGGGWRIGDIETHDLVTRRLCRDTRALVVSVDYRMLPEHPFPAPVHDAYDAISWASSLLPELPLLVAGDSAGGTLAACAVLNARDEHGPRIDGQVLIYPGVDDDFDTPSMLTYRDGPLNTLATIRYMIETYAQTPEALESQYALPARATSFVGLPPTIVAIPGHDLLRSSLETYAARLQGDGVAVTIQFDPELTHSWTDYAPRVPAADRAFTRLTDSINEMIGRAADSR